MKIDLKYFANLPETISPQEVEHEVDRLIQYKYDNSYDDEELMDAWVIIADRQFHTFQLPSEILKEKIYQWLVRNWTVDMVFQSRMCMIIGNFGIEKGLTLLKQELNNYLPDNVRIEISETIQELGDHINDPYYDLKK